MIPQQTSRYAAAPRYKGLSLDPEAELVPKRDAQQLQTDNISGSTLSFFPTNASSSAVHSNYIRNPLPRDISYDILGLGVSINWAHLFEDPSEQGNLPANLDEVLNDIFHARLKFETGQQKELYEAHLTEVGMASELLFQVEGSEEGGTNDGFTRRAKLPSTNIVRLPEPLHLEPQESWTFDVIFDDTTNIPSSTEWGNLGKGTPRMVAGLQLAFNAGLA